MDMQQDLLENVIREKERAEKQEKLEQIDEYTKEIEDKRNEYKQKFNEYDKERELLLEAPVSEMNNQKIALVEKKMLFAGTVNAICTKVIDMLDMLHGYQDIADIFGTFDTRLTEIFLSYESMMNGTMAKRSSMKKIKNIPKSVNKMVGRLNGLMDNFTKSANKMLGIKKTRRKSERVSNFTDESLSKMRADINGGAYAPKVTKKVDTKPPQKPSSSDGAPGIDTD